MQNAGLFSDTVVSIAGETWLTQASAKIKNKRELIKNFECEFLIN
jgi:hypothetical protein